MSARVKASARRRRIGSGALRALIYTSAFSVSAVLLFILLYVAVRGAGHIRISDLSLDYNSENTSMLPAVINTFTVTLTALALSLPIGLCAAVYLSEYTSGAGGLVRFLRGSVRTMSGIPSVIYGLVGYLLFVSRLGLGYSILGGGITLAMMLLPIIITTAEDALEAVPARYRDGAFGLGAGRLRTVWRIVLPSALPGIISGVLLALGRALGESAALIYTAGTVAAPAGFLDSGRTLAVHIYTLMNEGLYTDRAFAASFVLVIIIAVVDIAAERVASRLARRHLG